MAEEPKKFTLQDLAQYDGKNGRPVYIAHKGKVYDVSASVFWFGGDHMGTHYAGKDLTSEIDMAPHREEVFERVKLVGVLI